MPKLKQKMILLNVQYAIIFMIKIKILCYPCISFPSIYPPLINSKLHNKNESYEKVINLSICNHPAHFECYKGLNYSGEYYQCKVDN